MSLLENTVHTYLEHAESSLAHNPPTDSNIKKPVHRQENIALPPHLLFHSYLNLKKVILKSRHISLSWWVSPH